jgi:membrane protein
VRAGGSAEFAIVGLVVFTLFWWFTMWLLLAGRIPWRRLLPCAVATGVFWLGMEEVFAVIFSGMVTSDHNEYGPIGTVFALMSYLIAIGVVVVLGAVTGLVWQERGPSFRAAFRQLRPNRN